MSAIGTRKNGFAFAFTAGCIKILIVTTTIINSSALTLTSIMVKVMFRGTFFMIATFTDALFIQNLMWCTLCVRRAFAFTAIQILDLWPFAKLKPAITVTDSLIKELWKVACFFIWTFTLTNVWFKNSRKMAGIFLKQTFTITGFFI